MKNIINDGQNTLIQPAHRVADSLRRMQEIALATNVGITELGQTHRYASAVFERTIATAYRMTEAACSQKELSPHRQAALYHLTQAYIHQMAAVTEDVSQEILRVLIYLEGGD